MNKSVVVLALFALIICLAQFLSCNNSEQSFRDKKIQEGFQLSQKFCGSCHLLPEPALLNKKTWAEYVLPKMAGLLGFRRFASDYIEGSDTSKNMTLEQWKNIVRYYVSQAPAEPLERATISPKINMQLLPFTVEMPVTGIRNPATTMVSIDTVKKMIVFADGRTEYIYTLTTKQAIDSIKIGVGVSNFKAGNPETSYALTMGVLYPSDAKSGTLSMLGNNPKFITIIDSLQRPVHANYTDLNDDHQQDIIVCEFGNTTGQLSWFERKDGMRFTKHILRALPGAVKTEVFDFNGDGRPDIMALMAQGDEGFFIYYNEGNGKFSEKRVVRLLPTQGSNYFELGDFNGDGFPDILASNGDNGDYPPILKGYHGIRIYLNNGKNQFTEKIFLPVNGIGKVIAKDFDADGDIDLASISYFPDYKRTPEESFIYWRNDSNFDFHPFSFAESTAGRWLTMDANDLDGDGDIDIVLGNAKFTVGDIPPALMKKWEVYSPSVLILKNTLR